MAGPINRDATPTTQHFASVTTVTGVMPALHAGTLAVAVVVLSTTSAITGPGAPWLDVPNGSQNANGPSCHAFYAFSPSGGLANPTFTFTSSVGNILIFGYSGVAGVQASAAGVIFDNDTTLRNAASTNVSFTPAVPVGATDMAVAIGMQAGTSTISFTGGTQNGFGIWVNPASSGLCLADKQLAVSGSVGTTTMVSGT